MPQRRLAPDEVHFIMKMKKVGYSNCEIARRVGVSEGTIRYRKKRKEAGLPDRRKEKTSKLGRYDSFIKSWINDFKDDKTKMGRCDKTLNCVD